MWTADQCAMAAALTQFFLHLVKHTISLLLQSQSAAFGSYCEASGGPPWLASLATHWSVWPSVSPWPCWPHLKLWSTQPGLGRPLKRCVLILDQAYVQTSLLLHWFSQFWPFFPVFSIFRRLASWWNGDESCFVNHSPLQLLTDSIGLLLFPATTHNMASNVLPLQR